MNKSIKKKYEEIAELLKQNKSEEAKQQYLIIFKELDLQLNKELDNGIKKQEYTGRNISEEILRIETILSLLKYRREFRVKMVDDFTKLIGYAPYDLDSIEQLDSESDYVAYRTNLIIANELISELLETRKKVENLKSAIEKKSKSKSKNLLIEELNAIQMERSSKIETLKNNEDVLDDVYNYCLSAPFNEETAYIEYLLIKINPGAMLKINPKKRTLKRPELKENILDTIEVENMPKIESLGSVKPNNILTNMEEYSQKFEDINLPSNGLVNNAEKIIIDTNSLIKNDND